MSQKTVRVIKVASNAGRVVGQSLRNLRTLVGLSQSEMASRLGVNQSAISKIEHRGDVQISSLERYVLALGARLHIDASFSPNAAKDIFFDAELIDDNQLVFPIFGDDRFRFQRDVVLSVRPQYSDKIMNGIKTVELRRRFPLSAPRGTFAYIYSTSPVRAMVGRAEIVKVSKLPVKDIWKKYSDSASISKKEFEAYFTGIKEGYALKFANVRPFPRQLNLAELRTRFGFEPPQSFLYANPLLRKALLNEYDVSN